MQSRQQCFDGRRLKTEIDNEIMDRCLRYFFYQRQRKDYRENVFFYPEIFTMNISVFLAKDSLSIIRQEYNLY